MRLLLNSPWYVLLFCLAFALGLSLFLYHRNRKKSDAPSAVLVLMTALRFITLFLCSVLLADILLRQVVNETQQPRVIIGGGNRSSKVRLASSELIKLPNASVADVAVPR